MVQDTRDIVYRPPGRRFDMRELSRVAAWALVALGAVTIATLAASTPRGEDRLILAVAGMRGVPPPERLAHTPAEIQARQLADAVRNLSANREQLLARLDTLERNLGDITSSIRPPKSAAAAPLEPAAAPVIAAPATAATANAISEPAPDVAAPRGAPAAQSATPEEQQPPAAKTEFGIDLGRANTVEGLRQLWTATKNRHSAALEGLRPIVTVREPARSGGVELRLVVGPIPNAAAAARLCASLPGQACHPTVFDGQRLALR